MDLYSERLICPWGIKLPRLRTINTGYLSPVSVRYRSFGPVMTTVLIGFAVAGCSPHPLDAWSSDSTERIQDSPVTRPPVPPFNNALTTKAAYQEPVAELTMKDAWALTLTHNPKLARFAWEVRAAEARVLQAGRWSNPEIEVEFENFGGSGDLSGTSDLETTIALSQTIAIGSDITHRRRLAQLHGELVSWDYEAARITVLTEVTQRFVEVLAKQRQVELAQESMKLTEQVRDSIIRRVEAGVAPPVERLRAMMPVVTAKIVLQDTRQSLEAARLKLASNWGNSAPQFIEAVGSLDDIKPIPPLSLLIQMINHNPELARWTVEITARKAKVKLSQAEAMPDITAAVGYRRLNDSDDNALVAGISIPLPLFDRGQDEIRAEKMIVASAYQQQRAAELRVQAALAITYARVTSASSRAVALRDDALPPATEAYEAIQRAFDHGDLSSLDVLDAERTLIEFRQQYLDALTAYHFAVAEIESLIGQRLDTTLHPVPSESELPTKKDFQDTQP